MWVMDDWPVGNVTDKVLENSHLIEGAEGTIINMYYFHVFNWWTLLEFIGYTYMYKNKMQQKEHILVPREHEKCVPSR